MQIIHKWV